MKSDHCSSELLDRFYDDVLSPDELDAVTCHLNACPACRKRLAARKAVSASVRAAVNAVVSRTDFNDLDQKIIDRIVAHSMPFLSKLKNMGFSWRFYVPASAIAAVLLVFLTVFHQPPADPGPSAIINSFAGKFSSVMIIETPESRHTILWFSEESAPTGEENAGQKT